MSEDAWITVGPYETNGYKPTWNGRDAWVATPQSDRKIFTHWIGEDGKTYGRWDWESLLTK